MRTLFLCSIFHAEMPKLLTISDTLCEADCPIRGTQSGRLSTKCRFQQSKEAVRKLLFWQSYIICRFEGNSCWMITALQVLQHAHQPESVLQKSSHCAEGSFSESARYPTICISIGTAPSNKSMNLFGVAWLLINKRTNNETDKAKIRIMGARQLFFDGRLLSNTGQVETLINHFHLMMKEATKLFMMRQSSSHLSKNSDNIACFLNDRWAFDVCFSFVSLKWTKGLHNNQINWVNEHQSWVWGVHSCDLNPRMMFCAKVTNWN